MSDKKNPTDKSIFHDAMKIMKDLELSEIEMQLGDAYIRLKKSKKCMNVQPICNETIVKTPIKENFKQEIDECFVKSPIVGRVYVAPKENADPFVKVDDVVKKGQVLFIVEAMKVMNDVKAPKAGVVKKILVKNETPVEYGQPLLLLE